MNRIRVNLSNNYLLGWVTTLVVSWLSAENVETTDDACHFKILSQFCSKFKPQEQHWMPVSFHPLVVTVVFCVQTDTNIRELVDEVARFTEYLLNRHR